eukprot:354622-Chlamydomonas_euryale.AAC.14
MLPEWKIGMHFKKTRLAGNFVPVSRTVYRQSRAKCWPTGTGQIKHAVQKLTCVQKKTRDFTGCPCLRCGSWPLWAFLPAWAGTLQPVPQPR